MVHLDNCVDRYLNFNFLEPGELADQELRLVLTAKNPADPLRNYVPCYKFNICTKDSDERAGHIELRVGETHDLVMYGGHIGYGIEPKHRGHRFASRACNLLLPLARAHELSEIWITCVTENIASRRTCEILGAEFIEIVEVPEHTNMYQEGERQKCRYCLKM